MVILSSTSSPHLKQQQIIIWIKKKQKSLGIFFHASLSLTPHIPPVTILVGAAPEMIKPISYLVDLCCDDGR